MSGELRSAIDNFCMREYGCMPDYEKPTRVGILYTTVSNDELGESDRNGWEKELQIDADVIHFRLIFNFIDGTPRPGYVDEFGDEQEMAECIRSMDFQSLYSFALDVSEFSAYYKKDWEFYDWDETEELDND